MQGQHPQIAQNQPRRVPVGTALVDVSSRNVTKQAVIEKRGLGYVQQEIIFSNRSYTPGENSALVSLRTGAGLLGLSALPSRPRTSLTDQARQAFPQAREIQEEMLGQNGLGAFGYVIVRGQGRDRCILALQSKVGPKSAYDVKLRLCVPGASNNSLTGFMRSLAPARHAAFDPSFVPSGGYIQ